MESHHRRTDPGAPVATPGTFRAGSLLGFDILVHWSWFAVFFLVAWSLEANYLPSVYPEWSTAHRWAVGIAVAVLFFGSVLAHELAHAVVARRRGYPVHHIALYIFGGASAIGHEPRNRRDEFWIAIAGPLTNVALAGLLGGLWLAGRALDAPDAYAIAGYLALMNLLLAAFNLLPGFPLDGGRVLRALAWTPRRGLLGATRIASVSGRIVAAALIAWGIVVMTSGGLLTGLWPIVIGWFLWSAADMSYQQLLLQTSLGSVPVDAIAERAVPRVPPDMTVQQLVEERILRGPQRAFFVAATDDGDVLGLITLADIQRLPRQSWPDTSVYRAMTPRDKLVTATPRTAALAALELMGRHNMEQIPVFDGRTAVGLVSRAGLAQAVQVRSAIARGAA